MYALTVSTIDMKYNMLIGRAGQLARHIVYVLAFCHRAQVSIYIHMALQLII